eukprot:2144278-Pyramimonas_sp.AAC.1
MRAEEAAANKRKRPKGEKDLSAHLEWLMAVDEANMGGSSQYSATMSRWAVDTMRAVESQAWWAVAAISHAVCSPWRELRAFLQRHDRLVQEKGIGALAALAWGEAQTMYDNALLMTEMMYWEDLLDQTHDDLLYEVAAACRELSMINAVNFKMRILDRLSTYPVKLLLLAKGQPADVNENRAAIAREILDDSTTEMNVVKLKAIARRELEECAVMGQLDPDMWMWLRNICSLWQGDTERMESFNKVVKEEVVRAPHISQALIAARAVNKTFVHQVCSKAMAAAGQSKKKSRVKWSMVQDSF